MSSRLTATRAKVPAKIIGTIYALIICIPGNWEGSKKPNSETVTRISKEKSIEIMQLEQQKIPKKKSFAPKKKTNKN